MTGIQAAREQAASIRAESGVLVSFLESLSDSDWKRSSNLGEWQVRDIVVHLVERAVGFYSQTMARGLQEDVSEPPGFDLPQGVDLQTGRKNIEQRAIQRRADDMGPLVSLLEEQTSNFYDLQINLKPEDLDKPCWVANGTRPVREIGPIIVQEVAVHSWDIRSQFDSDSPLAPETAKPLAERIIWVLENPQIQQLPPDFSINSGETTPVTYRLTLSDLPSGRRDLVLDQKRVHMEKVSESDADATLGCDSETFSLILFDRITIDDAIQSGALRAEGPEALISDLNSWLINVTMSNMQ